MHSPDTPSTCLAPSAGLLSSKRLRRPQTSIMKPQTTSAPSSADNLVCAPEPSALLQTGAPSGAATPGCALLRLLPSSSVPVRTALALLAGFCLLSPAPARAQIRKLVEENGRIIFVNADENAPARTGKGKGASANSNS